MQPLSGIRVLDLSRLLPGPFASLMLADMGATVDKVEDPTIGDYLRHTTSPEINGASAAFHALNRGKRSLVLDLKHPLGTQVFLRLLAHYDILLEQFRPGVLDRLGLAHSYLQKKFPKLIICALTGYGQTSPLAKRAGHDLNYLARAGLLGFQGPPNGIPSVPAWQLADIAGGLWCALAIMAALRERDHTGAGSVIDMAMTDGVIGFATPAFGSLFAGQAPTRGEEVLSGGIAPYNIYFTKDDKLMALAALEPKFWISFCEGVGIPYSLSDLSPGPHQTARKAELATLFLSKTRAQWEAFAAQQDCCLEPVLEPHELAQDAHLRARDIFFDIDVNGTPIRQYRTPVTPKDKSFSPPPKNGEHSDTILKESGFSDKELEELRIAGVIR